jgi:protoporphyrinogen oxidase
VVILGGGISGISAAFLLLRQSADPDLRVDLLEKRDFAGGLCHTVELGGFRFDFGPHNIHSTDAWFDSLMKELLGEQYRRRSYKAQVVFRDRFVPYPMEGIDVLRGVPLATSLGCAASFLWSRAESLFREWDDGDFESFIVNRFGRKMYDVFFGPFTEKTWGVTGRELSSDLGRQRVGVFTLWDLFKRTVLGIRPKASITGEEDPFLNQRTFYPDYGSGSIIAALLEPCLRDSRFALHASTEVESIERTGDTYSVSAAGSVFEADLCLSSIALTDLLRMLHLPDPGLRYISTRFLMLTLGQDNVFGTTPFVYFSDDSTRFNRVSEPRNMSPLMAPEGRTSLCVEYTTTREDDIWRASGEDLLDWALSGLGRHGLLRPGPPSAWKVIDWENTYPLRTVDYREDVASALGSLRGHPGIVPFGRLGRFEYLNMDHCVADARKAVSAVLEPNGRR